MDIEQRIVESPSWRWMPGMLATHRRTSDIRVVTCDGDEPPYPFLPDLEDPATLGCVLALVREHLDAPRAYVEVRADVRARVVSSMIRKGAGRMRDIYGIVDHTGWVVGGEAEALVEALTQVKRGDR